MGSLILSLFLVAFSSYRITIWNETIYYEFFIFNDFLFLWMNYSAPVHHCGVNGWGCCMPMKLNTYSDIRWIQHCITDRRKEIWAWKWCVRLVNLRELGECLGNVYDVLESFIYLPFTENQQLMENTGHATLKKTPFTTSSMLRGMRILVAINTVVVQRVHPVLSGMNICQGSENCAWE